MSPVTLTHIRRTPRHSVRGDESDFYALGLFAVLRGKPIMRTMGEFLTAAARLGDVTPDEVANRPKDRPAMRFWAASDDDVQQVREWRERTGLTWPEAVHVAANIARRDMPPTP